MATPSFRTAASRLRPSAATLRLSLRSEGLRATPQRVSVLEVLAAASDHLSADDVWFALRSGGASVSRATVYRTLASLAAAGLVRELPLGAGHAHFELAREGDHHEHLICDRCGAVLDVNDPPVEDVLLSVCAAQGFVPTTHTIEVHGLCARCAPRRGRRRPPSE